MFAIYGIPEEVKTDNGTPFQSDVFARFSIEKGFIYRKVTPLWPEANGQVENFMKNIGKVAKTAHVSGKNWKKELYTYFSASIFENQNFSFLPSRFPLNP